MRRVNYQSENCDIFPFMNGKDSIGEFLINQYPYKVHQVRSQTGELVWVQAGVNPDNVFQDKRRSDWPYSEITADLICQQIVEGASLTKVCKMQGFPSYGIVCRWRRENPDFEVALNQAYKDRAEFYLESAIDIVNDLETKHDVRKARLKWNISKWIVACQGDSLSEEGKLPLSFSVFVR